MIVSQSNYHIHPFQYPKKFDEKLINKYKINLHEVETLNIFEAYVEFIAILINSFIYEYKFKTTNALQKEILQQFHTVKQLQMYKPYSESTNIFAYVFLKTYFIMNMNDVLNKTKDDDYCPTKSFTHSLRNLRLECMELQGNFEEALAQYNARNSDEYAGFQDMQ